MGNLDPLKFSIQIIDDIDSQLSKLRSKVEQGFRDVPLTLKVENLDKLRRDIESITRSVNFALPDAQNGAAKVVKEVTAEKNREVEANRKLVQSEGELGKAVTDSISKQAWKDIEALQKLITQIQATAMSVKMLKEANLAQNTSVSSGTYKMFEKLNAAISSAVGSTSALSPDGLKDFTSRVREEFSRLEAEIKNKGEGFSRSFKEMRDRIKENMGLLSSMGNVDNGARSVQEQMAGVPAAFNGHILSMKANFAALKEAISNDNFAQMKTRIENAAVAMEKLDAAFRNFHGTISNDVGFRDFMTGLGEVIGKMRFQLSQVGEGVGNISGDNAMKNYIKNLDKVEEALYKLSNAHMVYTESMRVVGANGGDTRWMKLQFERADAYAKKLQELKNDEARLSSGDMGTAFGRVYKAILSGANEASKTAGEYETAAKRVTQTTLAIDEAINKGKSALGNGVGGKRADQLRGMIGDLEVLRRVIAGTGDKKAAMELLSDREKFGVALKSMSASLQAEGVRVNGDAVRGMAENLGRAITNVRTLSAEQDAVARNQRKYGAMMESTETWTNRLNQALAEANGHKKLGANIDATPLEEVRKKIEALRGEIQKRGLGNLADTRTMDELTFRFKKLRTEQGSVVGGAEKANRDAAKTTKADAAKQAESMRQAGIEVNKLTEKISEWKSKVEKGAKLGVDTSAAEAAVKQMEKRLGVLRDIQHGQNKTVASKYTGSVAYDADMRAAKASVKAVEEQTRAIEINNRKAKDDAVKAKAELSAQEQRLQAEIAKTTQAMSGQSQVLGDLKSMAFQYLSVWGAQQFLGNIIEIGGQLENQRLSIGAILGDVAQANTLFGQIQGLAVKSPFGVVELDQYTKQLSAFGYQYNELYDMTRRLADISAGAGTDVGRLALALGHVKSEGALTGYTLRQFAMNNIPMLQKLSDLLSEREGRLVSTKEIRNRVRSKAIDYNDVETVIKQLTDEGGMFYNMQEVISGSVKSRWKNLKDAMDVMYGSMAESGMGDILKDTAQVLTGLTKRWREILAVVGAGASVWVAARLAAMLYNGALGQGTAATLRAMSAARRHEMELLKTASRYRLVTAAELENAGSKSTATINTIRLALNTKKLTTEELARAVALGKVTKAEAVAAIAQSEMSKQQKKAAATMLANTKQLDAFGRMSLRAEVAIGRLSVAMKALMVNPMTWIMAAVSVITELWAKNSAEMEKMKEAYDGVYGRGDEGIKNAKSMMASNGIKAYTADGKDVTGAYERYSDVNIKFPVYMELDPASRQQVMEEAEQFIREYASRPNELLNDAFAASVDGSVKSLREQYESLERSVNAVVKAQRILRDEIADAARYGLESTDGGWFNESLITNINDYSKTLQTYHDNITNFVRDREEFAERLMNVVEKDASFGADVRKRNEELLKESNRVMTLSEKYQMLMDNRDKYKSAYVTARIDVGDFGSRYARQQGGVMEDDLSTFVNSVKSKLTELGWDFKKLSREQKQALTSMVTEVVSKASDSTDAVKDMVVKMALEKFGIKIDVDEAEAAAKIAQFKKELEALTGNKWWISIGVNPDDLISLRNSIKDNMPKAKEEMEQYRRTLKKFGVETDGKTPIGREVKGANGNSRWLYNNINPEIEEWGNRYNELINSIKGAEEAVEKYGLIVDGGNDKKGGGSRSKSYQDPEVKKWQERVKVVKEAYDWYEKWRKDYGEGTALGKMQEAYGGIMKELDIKTENVLDLKKYLKLAETFLTNRWLSQRNDKTKDYGKQAMAAVREVKKSLGDFDYDMTRKASEEYASSMSRQLEVLAEKWKVFDSVRKATGDDMAASVISGLSASDVSLGNIAEASKRYVSGVLEGMGMAVDFDKVLGMGDRQISLYVQDLFEGKADDEKKSIDGVVNALKEWRKLQMEIFNEAVSSYNSLIASGQSYADQVNRINSAYKNSVEANKGIRDTDERSRADGVAETTRDKALLDISYDAYRFFNNYKNIANSEISSIAKNLTEKYKAIFDKGGISAKEYADKVEKINDIMRKYGGVANGKSIYEKMSANGGVFYGKNSEGNIKDIASANADVLYRLGVERGKGEDADGNLISVLERLAKALQNIMSGVGGRSEVRTAGLLGNAVDRWDEMSHVDKKRTGSYADNSPVPDEQTKTHRFTEKANKSLEVFSKGLEAATTALGFMGEFADNVFGGSNAIKDAQTVMGGAQSGMSAGKGVTDALAGIGVNLGPWGAATGAAMGIVSGIFAQHDAKLLREVERLREKVTEIENNTSLIKSLRERTLGYDKSELSHSLFMAYARAGRNTIFSYGSGKTKYDMMEYYARGNRRGDASGYQQEYDNLVKTRQDYLDVLDKQEKMKNKSDADIEATKKQIAELDVQIINFAEDTANSLWGIDVKSWAQQLSDALCTAFENGTSAVKAYDDTVRQMIQDVVKNMMSLSIIQPLMEKLRDRLFGKANADGTMSGGVVDMSDPLGSADKAVNIISQFFGSGGEGNASITAASQFWTSLERGLNDLGLSMKNDSGETLGNSVKGISEETANLLAGYVNALRQDVSVNRIVLEKFTGETWNSYISQITQVQGSLNSIDNNVAAILSLVNEQGQLYRKIDSIDEHLSRFANGIDRITTV